MEALIRPATRDDLPAVSRLLRDTWHATYDDLFGADAVQAFTARWHNVEALSWALGKPHHAFLVAVEGDRILGTASAVWRDGITEVIRLYVRPAAQGRGLGQSLLAAACAALPAATLLRLTVEARNTAARHFYETHAFRWTGGTSKDALGEALIYEAQGAG